MGGCGGWGVGGGGSKITPRQGNIPRRRTTWAGHFSFQQGGSIQSILVVVACLTFSHSHQNLVQ